MGPPEKVALNVSLEVTYHGPAVESVRPLMVTPETVPPVALSINEVFTARGYVQADLYTQATTNLSLAALGIPCSFPLKSYAKEKRPKMSD